MLIFEYFNGQLERMFTDRDTEYVDRMCWHLDNPITDMWTYYTEDNKPILFWDKDGIIHGNVQGPDEAELPERRVCARVSDETTILR